jgi:hypothetical protein
MGEGETAAATAGGSGFRDELVVWGHPVILAGNEKQELRD